MTPFHFGFLGFLSLDFFAICDKHHFTTDSLIAQANEETGIVTSEQTRRGAIWPGTEIFEHPQPDFELDVTRLEGYENLKREKEQKMKEC